MLSILLQFKVINKNQCLFHVAIMLIMLIAFNDSRFVIQDSHDGFKNNKINPIELTALYKKENRLASGNQNVLLMLTFRHRHVIFEPILFHSRQQCLGYK